MKKLMYYLGVVVFALGTVSVATATVTMRAPMPQSMELALTTQPNGGMPVFINDLTLGSSDAQQNFRDHGVVTLHEATFFQRGFDTDKTDLRAGYRRNDAFSLLTPKNDGFKSIYRNAGENIQRTAGIVVKTAADLNVHTGIYVGAAEAKGLGGIGQTAAAYHFRIELTKPLMNAAANSCLVTYNAMVSG